MVVEDKVILMVYLVTNAAIFMFNSRKSNLSLKSFQNVYAVDLSQLNTVVADNTPR